MSSSNCCFLSCMQISQEAVGWLGIPISLKIFHSLFWSTVKGFDIVSKAEVDVFSGTLAFSMVQQMLAIWCLIPLPFLSSAWKVPPLFLFLYLSAFPRFVLLCHISPHRLSSGHSSQVLTLRTNNAVRTSVPSPHSLLVDGSIWVASPLVMAVRCILCVCVCVCVCVCMCVCVCVSVWLCCFLRSQSSPLTPSWEGFLLYGKFCSFTTPFPEWVHP